MFLDVGYWAASRDCCVLARNDSKAAKMELDEDVLGVEVVERLMLAWSV